MRNFQNTFDTRKRSFISVFQKISKYVLRILFWGSPQSLDLSLRKLHGFWRLWMKIHCKNTVISPNFLVWKLCGKTQFPQSFGRIARNYAETVPFHKTFTRRNQVKLWYFCSGLFILSLRKSYIYIYIRSSGLYQPFFGRFQLILEIRTKLI